MSSTYRFDLHLWASVEIDAEDKETAEAEILRLFNDGDPNRINRQTNVLALSLDLQEDEGEGPIQLYAINGVAIDELEDKEII